MFFFSKKKRCKNQMLKDKNFSIKKIETKKMSKKITKKRNSQKNALPFFPHQKKEHMSIFNVQMSINVIFF